MLNGGMARVRADTGDLEFHQVLHPWPYIYWRRHVKFKAMAGSFIVSDKGGWDLLRTALQMR